MGGNGRQGGRGGGEKRRVVGGEVPHKPSVTPARPRVRQTEQGRRVGGGEGTGRGRSRRVRAGRLTVPRGVVWPPTALAAAAAYPVR